MAIVTTSVVDLIVTLLIGIVVGFAFNRLGGSWLGRKVAGATGAGDVTYALVGIAGAFIGFHIAFIVGLLPSPLMLFLGAAAGAALTVFLWRNGKY